MQTVEERVRAKRAEVESQRAVVVRKLEELKVLQVRLESLEEQAAMLDSLLAGDDTADEFVLGGKPSEGLPTPQVGVVNLLSRHPDGLTQSQIIESLIGKVATVSKNPRAVLRNTVHNLLKSEKIVRDGDVVRTRDPLAALSIDSR